MSSQPLMDRETLQRLLFETIHAYPFEETRFYNLLDKGRCSRKVLEKFANSTYLGAKLFCASLAELVIHAPDNDAKLLLLENLMEEEGIFLRPDSGLSVRKQANHQVLALKFADACGNIIDDVILNHNSHLLNQGRQWILESRWLEAAAYLLIGQELKFSSVSEKMFNVLIKNGFQRKDLAFFAIHIEADMKHGQQAMDIVIDRAVTPELQLAVIAAADAGAKKWFQMHGGYSKNRGEQA